MQLLLCYAYQSWGRHKTQMYITKNFALMSTNDFFLQVGPDWICIALGFESGNVRFYTDNGQLLFQEQIHYERVCGIKCQSQHSPRPDINSMLQPEEVYVQYPNTICVIAGSNLFSTLRNCRSQLAIGKSFY